LHPGIPSDLRARSIGANRRLLAVQACLANRLATHSPGGKPQRASGMDIRTHPMHDFGTFRRPQATKMHRTSRRKGHGSVPGT
jgi:hypothetical protein